MTLPLVVATLALVASPARPQLTTPSRPTADSRHGGVHSEQSKDGQWSSELPAFSWFDPTRSFEERAAMLVGNMTAIERITQLVKFSPPIERLGVPGYNYHMEAAHGVATGGDVTVFPCSLARAASFDLDIERGVAATTQREARAKWNMYLHVTNHTPAYNSEGLSLTLYAPEMNLCRDPRWGRCQESRGEDPHLTSRFTVEFVKALQDSNGSKYLPVTAMLKDFPVYNLESSQPAGGTDWQVRTSYNAVVNAADLKQSFLPAFRAGTIEAGVETIMTSYHAINGIPATASPMLQDVLRDEWKFNGSVVSDGGAVTFILNFKYLNLSMTDNITAAAAAALNSGCDMNSGGFERAINPPSCSGCAPNMTGYAYAHLPEALARGMVDIETITRSATRLFELRMKLGFFDPPSLVPYTKLGWKDVDTNASRSLARRSAQESLVLLHASTSFPWNEKAIKKLAIIGPNANSTSVLLSDYNAPCGAPSKYVNVGLPGRKCRLVSILDGARAAMSASTTIVYEQGCNLTSQNTSGLEPATQAAQSSDATIIVVGLDSGFGPSHLEGEAHDRVNLTLPGLQMELIRRVLAVQPNSVVVVISGSAVSIPELMNPTKTDGPAPVALIQQFYPGEEGGNALMDVVFGKVDFSGKLPVTIVEKVSDLPPYLEQNMSFGMGRTYRYFRGEPLYPFGYGASAHLFSYSDLAVMPQFSSLNAKPKTVKVSFTLTLQGVATISATPPVAEEVVQIYVSFAVHATSGEGPRPFDNGSAVPRWELKYFDRVLITSAEHKVEVTLALESLALAAEDGTLQVLPGRYTFSVGGTSPETPTRLLRPAAPFGPESPISTSIVVSADGEVFLA